jgi:large subunit ribosomal protein L31
MKKDIHPENFEVKVRCVCGNNFTTTSTSQRIEPNICSNCHPFYTGAQKFVDTAGRIDRFQQRYSNAPKRK